MKTKIKPIRCKRCKKNTLTEISGEMQHINRFILRRTYHGVQCQSCGWNDKTYTFVEEGKD